MKERKKVIETYTGSFKFKALTFLDFGGRVKHSCRQGKQHEGVVTPLRYNSRFTTDKIEKVDSHHFPAIKFIGKKKLVKLCFKNYHFCKYAKFEALS